MHLAKKRYEKRVKDTFQGLELTENIAFKVVRNS